MSRAKALSAALLVLLSALVVQWVRTAPNKGGETEVLVKGARTAMHCLTSGPLVRCGTTAEEKRLADVGRSEDGALESAVAPFAALQYVPTVGLLGIGASTQQTYKALALLSMAAFLALLAVLWALAKRSGRPEWAPGLVLVCLAGPLLFYANSTLGEMLAAFVMVLFVAALVLERRWWLVGAAALLAGLSKETAPVFLAALAAIVVLGLRSRGRPMARTQLIAAAGGLAVAVVTNLLFNVFRYGTITNLDYAHSSYGQPRPPLGERPELFAGLFFAPNGGILSFWPTATLLIGAVAVLGVVALRGGSRRDAWPALALVGLFLVFMAGLASWRGPFGWWAWGPRLTLPWVPVFLAAAVVLYGDELARIVRPLTRTVPRLVATALAVTVVTAPHIGVMWNRDAFWNFFLDQDPVCQAIATADTARYYDCMQHRAWAEKPPLLSALSGLGTAGGAITLVAFFAASAALLMSMRDAHRAPARAPTRLVVAPGASRQ